MTLQFLLAQIALGEDSTRQFKADVKNADSLASVGDGGLCQHQWRRHIHRRGG